jgi:hypothetical protein
MMQMKNKIIFKILFILLISSCRGFYEPITLNMVIPDGPENYQAGWYTGCRSALGSMPNYGNSMVYDVTFANGQYQNDPVYQEAWANAFFSCSIHTGTFRTFGGEKSMRAVFD